MFSSIPALRAELTARLQSALPADWRIVDDLVSKDETQKPAVYIEFTGLDSTFDGKPLPHGVLAATVQVIVSDPRTTALGEAGSEEHVVKIIAALDPHPDLAWSSAVKQKIERTGQWAWALTLSAFVAVPTITEGA